MHETDGGVGAAALRDSGEQRERLRLELLHPLLLRGRLAAVRGVKIVRVVLFGVGESVGRVGESVGQAGKSAASQQSFSLGDAP